MRGRRCSQTWDNLMFCAKALVVDGSKCSEQVRLLLENPRESNAKNRTSTKFKARAGSGVGADAFRRPRTHPSNIVLGFFFFRSSPRNLVQNIESSYNVDPRKRIRGVGGCKGDFGDGHSY